MAGQIEWAIETLGVEAEHMEVVLSVGFEIAVAFEDRVFGVGDHRTIAERSAYGIGGLVGRRLRECRVGGGHHEVLAGAG